MIGYNYLARLGYHHHVPFGATNMMSPWGKKNIGKYRMLIGYYYCVLLALQILRPYGATDNPSPWGYK